MLWRALEEKWERQGHIIRSPTPDRELKMLYELFYDYNKHIATKLVLLDEITQKNHLTVVGLLASYTTKSTVYSISLRVVVFLVSEYSG